MKYIFLIIFALIIVSCNNTPYVQGKRLFAANCANCHMEDGSGLGELIPPLNKSALLGQASMVCIVKNGVKDTLFKDSTYLLKEMPSFSHLSATEVTNIINFINYKWHPAFKEITILDVEQALKSCQ